MHPYSYGPGTPTDYQDKMRQLYELLKSHPELRKKVPAGELSMKQVAELLSEFKSAIKKDVRPQRETIINSDDVLNLRIAMETMTFNEFVEAM